uniref:DUF7622 domain-containing protein n=1 Tax=Panagrolaimus superbus TaxID=310955 RepID=A0A914YGV3_9BILA
MLGCSCSANDCNLKNPYPVEKGNVHCHLAYGATSEDQLNAKEYCRGDFCVLQKTVVPGYGTQWLKGCLSANETDSASKLKPGYRNILGIEQWMCQTDFCNFDVQSIGDSTPHLASVNLFSPQPRGGKQVLKDSAHEQLENDEVFGKEHMYAVKVDQNMKTKKTNGAPVNFATKHVVPVFVIICIFEHLVF